MLLYMYIILYNENNDIIAGLQPGGATHFWVREVFVVRGRYFLNWPQKGNITHKSKYNITSSINSFIYIYKLYNTCLGYFCPMSLHMAIVMTRFVYKQQIVVVPRNAAGQFS